MGFAAKLDAAWHATRSMLCVGLDPDPGRYPADLAGRPDAAFELSRRIADATAAVACAFKPQFAHFAAQGAEDQLERLCHYLADTYPDKVLILDAKRGDIGSTAEHYATEAFVRYGADAVTVNPYLGTDAVEPFLRHDGKGTIILCRTSNPGGSDLQSLDVGGRPLYARVAELVAERWSAIGECGLVVGATYPEELGEVRSIVGDLPILVPGVGAQGGDPAVAVRTGHAANGYGLIVNASRALMYASSGPDYADAAGAAARQLADQLAPAAAARSPRRAGLRRAAGGRW